MGRRILQLLVLVVGVIVFFSTLMTVYVSLWADAFEFRYYFEAPTPQGIYNTIVYFAATMLVAVMAGRICTSMMRRGYSHSRSAVVAIAALAFVYHWTSPIVEYLSYHPDGTKASYDIFTAVPWKGQWGVDFEEVIALAIASSILFLFEMVRRDLFPGPSTPEFDHIIGETAGDSI